MLVTGFAVGRRESGVRGRCSVPLLDLVEALEEGNRNEDDDGLLAVADFDLWEDSVSERSTHPHAQVGLSRTRIIPSQFDCVEVG